MFLQETKQQRIFKRKSSWTDDIITQKRIRTLYHFQCDHCKQEFVREKGSTHKYTLTKTKTHICENCTGLFLSLRTGNETQKRKRQSFIGQRRVCKHTGYLEIYVGPDYPFHAPRSRLKSYHWKREHIYLMEQHLGRVLEQGEVVHHIDGNKQNNNLGNLDIMTVAEHNKCHGQIEYIVFDLVKRGVVVYNKTSKRYELTA
jgi:hypothetical protein